MLTAGSFFFVPYFLTNKTNVSYGQANLTYYGLSRGMIHGLMLSYIIDGNARPETNFGISVVTGITEGIFGYSLVNKLKLSDGTANTITVYGDNGLMAGLLLSNQSNLSLIRCSIRNRIRILYFQIRRYICRRC
jgi:hypothetical protein